MTVLRAVTHQAIGQRHAVRERLLGQFLQCSTPRRELARMLNCRLGRRFSEQVSALG